MRYLILAATLTLSYLTGRGQPVIDVNATNFPLTDPTSGINNVSGLVYQPIKFIKVTAGSPFFKDQWMKARLFDANGESYASHSVRLNLFDNYVNFLDAKGTEMVTTTPVKKIQLTDTTNGTQYLFVLGDQIPGIDKVLARVWLEVLVNDKISLCRQIKKIMRETTPYRDATAEEEIVSVDHYFVRMDDNLVLIKGWPDLVQLFTDKKAAVDQYIHVNHLKGKSTDDYTLLVQYYNKIKNI